MNNSAFRRIVMSGMFGLFLVSACASVSAQSLADALSVKIPFEFTVGEKTLPAGEYTIQRLRDTPAILVIQSADRGSRAVIWTTPMDDSQSPAKTKLVFSDYGDRRFLAQVWIQGEKSKRTLAKSRAERELAKTASAKTSAVSLSDNPRQK
jgi:hypothetical protein